LKLCRGVSTLLFPSPPFPETPVPRHSFKATSPNTQPKAMTYSRRKTSDFTVTARLRESEVEEYSDNSPAPESDPHPSFPHLRVVTTDGKTVEETTKPYTLAKCRQVTAVRLPKKVAG
jgi:hypothetical protein